MRTNKYLDHIMPIYKVEQDCILSRQGDMTLAFEVTLPEIFTLSGDDFEALHQAWIKAIRLLPDHSIVHKQDWFVESRYHAEFDKGDPTFLARASERFFNERPYLDHQCYLFLTKRPDKRRPASFLNSGLFRNSLAPLQTLDPKVRENFLDKAGQFVRVLKDSGYLELRSIPTDELVSHPDRPGLLERYCYLLHPQQQPVIRDLEIGPDLRVGDQYCQLFTLADVEDLPGLCGPRINYDKYSTDKSKFSIGFAAPLGQMLSCNHLYNQYIVVDDARATLKKMEAKRLRLQSLSSYSRENGISRDATNAFLNEAISQQRLPVKAHFNILSWTDKPDRRADVRNAVSAALAQMDARAHQETASIAQLFWAGMPGNAGDLPLQETFDTFAEQASCFLNVETNYRSSVSPVGMRLGERISGLPVHADLSDEPVTRGICSNRNKFILGPSGAYRAIFN
ncbi:TraG family conjugative transposon ATPase [Dinghuibacter silviterrae]|nr:TraG family conjugative transposon ATPase [Dinghuibacter silviterrae]